MIRTSMKLMIIALFAAISITSCKPKDEDIQKSVTEAIKTVAGVTAEVKDGVVTLSGNVTDEAAKTAAETAAKAISGVKSVVNNTAILPPAPPEQTVTNNPVVNAADEVLTKAVADATKDFPTIKAAVKDGVVSVTGEINTIKWKVLKMALDALKPKKVDASGLKVN